MHSLNMSFVTVALVMMGISVQAVPNLSATTGLMAVPTAEAVKTGEFDAAADILFHHGSALNGRIVYGVAKNIEIGTGFITGDDSASGFNAKVVMNGKIAGFTPAVGITLIGSSNKSVIENGTQIYLVGTKVIAKRANGTKNVTGTVGVNFTDISTVSAFRPFIGAQIHVNDKTEIDAEYMLATSNFSHSVNSVFIRHSIDRKTQVQAGFTNSYGFTGLADNNLFMGIVYSSK